MASHSILRSIAKGFAAATVAVAVTGEAVALVTKAKEDRVRPQGRMHRKTPFGPKPGALTVRTDTLVPLAVLCAVPVLSE